MNEEKNECPILWRRGIPLIPNPSNEHKKTVEKILEEARTKLERMKDNDRKSNTDSK